jgi:pyruvate dehydrogenase E1 component beta subunit
LLKTAVRDNNPVLVLEAELLYSSKGMVEPPDEELLIPLGKAEVKREGSDVTIICYAQTVPLALKVAAQLEEEDISAEVSICVRSNRSMKKAIFDSVAKTHRVVIVEQDHPFCGVGAEVCYRIQKNIFDELDAPICAYHRKMCPCHTTNDWRKRSCRTRRNCRRRL